MFRTIRKKKNEISIDKSVIYLIIAIPTIVFTIWNLFCGSIQIRCNDRDFNIEAKGWNDYTGEYSQIDSISYEENVLQNDNDYRTNGFGNLKYAMGNFKNDIFGDYIRYTHASCHSYVVMNIDGKILVVNGENDAETKEIYQRISEKVSKERKQLSETLRRNYSQRFLNITIMSRNGVPFSLDIPDKLVTRDSITQAEFDTMMQTGLAQAKKNDSVSVDEAFNQLKSEIQCMNEYEVRVTRLALEQMKEIVHYISNDLMAPDAADNLLDKMKAEITKLSSFPKNMP